MSVVQEVASVPVMGDAADRCEVRSVDAERVMRGRALLLSDAVYVRLADIFRTLADPSRARIVYCLLHQELCTCDLGAIVGLSDSAVSQHLRVLRHLQVVKSRRQGKIVYYSLADEHMRVLVDVALGHLQHEVHAGELPPSAIVTQSAPMRHR